MQQWVPSFGRPNETAAFSFKSLEKVNIPTGVGLSEDSFQVPSLNGPSLSNVRKTIATLENRDVAQRASNVVDIIQKLVSKMPSVIIQNIPHLYAFVDNDGSVTLEWVHNDYRICFNIEVIEDESGWLLVTTERLGNITTMGTFSGENVAKRIMWLICFMILHN